MGNNIKTLETHVFTQEISASEYAKIYNFFRNIGKESPMMNEILPVLAILRFAAWGWRKCF